MQLSRNFSLDEFLVSQTAERHGIDMSPSPEIEQNIRNYVETLLQPLRDEVKRAIFISSGYRPEELNTRIGGSRTSAHMFGEAADFRVAGMSPYEVCIVIRDMDLPYDQNIHEFGRWTHLGGRLNPRGQDLTAHRKDGATVYTPGILRMDEL
jgi:hypothetical protein